MRRWRYCGGGGHCFDRNQNPNKNLCGTPHSIPTLAVPPQPQHVLLDCLHPAMHNVPISRTVPIKHYWRAPQTHRLVRDTGKKSMGSFGESTQDDTPSVFPRDEFWNEKNADPMLWNAAALPRLDKAGKHLSLSPRPGYGTCVG